MSEEPGNSIIMLLKTNRFNLYKVITCSRLKELVTTVESLRKENSHLKEEVKEKERNCVENGDEWKKKYF